MARPVRAERLLLGLHGLALLRGWPLGDAATAEEHIETIRTLLGSEPPPLDVTHVTAADGYAVWAEHYDGWNPLIEAEEPAVRRFLEEIPPGRALDLACGTGRLSRVLTELGHGRRDRGLTGDARVRRFEGRRCLVRAR